MRTALHQGQSFQAEILNYRKNGQKFWNQLLIDPVHDDMGRLTHFVGIQRDITEERARQAELQLSQQVFAQSREGVVVTDARRRIVMVNNAFTSITGYTQQEVLGHNPSMLSAQRHDAVFYRDMWRAVINDGAWQGEVWNRHKNGTEYLERLAVHVLRDHDGNVSNYIGTFSDITEQRAAQERIDWLSHFDPLTQLPNRELLADRCTHDISLAQRDGKQLTMMVLDMDRFKLINETLGYDLGNRIIKKFARRLVQTVRSQDTVARLGADEFALVLPGETPDGAAHLVERLQAILSEPFGVADQEASTSVSIGIAVHPADGTDFEGLLKSALDEAKAPYSHTELEMLANRCTTQEDAANKVERQMRKSEAAMLLESRIGQTFDGVVTGQAKGNTWVRIFNPPAEGKLLPSGPVQVGDKVRAKLLDTNVERGFIDFEQVG
mgnify:CR=1 FL=1